MGQSNSLASVSILSLVVLLSAGCGRLDGTSGTGSGGAFVLEWPIREQPLFRILGGLLQICVNLHGHAGELIVALALHRIEYFYPIHRYRKLSLVRECRA